MCDVPKTRELSDGLFVKVVSTSEGFQCCVAIRAVVFIGGQDCPYAEEFDGNDLCASHLLCYIGQEPAGTLRIRWFSQFAKPERLAVQARFRGMGVAAALVAEAKELCRRKGYRYLYGHAQLRLLSFWHRQGFARHSALVFHFSDHEYVEIGCELEPSPKAITLDLPPLAIIRPEGSFDVPGVLEESQDRAPTNPVHDEGGRP